MKNNLLVVRLLGALLVYHLAACHQHDQHGQHQSDSGDHKPRTGSTGTVHYASSASKTNGHRRPPSSANWNHHQSRQNEEPAKDRIEGDELILLGDQGSGCWDDDDCTTFMTDTGSGSDDLITPRILSVPRTTLSPRQSISTPRIYVSGRGSNKQCDDDDDCVEGSGSDDNDPEPSATAGHRGIVYGLPTLSPPWPGGNPIAMPPTTMRYDRPPYIYATAVPGPPTPRTEEVDRSIMFTSKPIPPVYTGRSYTPPPRPSPPPRPTGKPVIVDVPKPMIPTYVKEKEVKPKPATTHTTYSKSSADRTALIIGLIAVILIVIVIIAPVIVFIKVRYRSNGSCKTVLEDRKNSHYQFAAAATPPPTTMLTAAAASNGAGHHGSVTHLHTNGSSMSVEFKQQQQLHQQQQAAKLPKKNKDLEWYV